MEQSYQTQNDDEGNHARARWFGRQSSRPLDRKADSVNLHTMTGRRIVCRKEWRGVPLRPQWQCVTAIRAARRWRVRGTIRIRSRTCVARQKLTGQAMDGILCLAQCSTSRADSRVCFASTPGITALDLLVLPTRQCWTPSDARYRKCCGSCTSLQIHRRDPCMFR